MEIIASAVELDKLLASLDKAGVPGYTVMRNVTGKSARGTITDDLAMTHLDNVYIIAFFPPNLTEPVVEAVRPILNKFGGVCYLSEVTEIRSVRCIAST